MDDDALKATFFRNTSWKTLNEEEIPTDYQGQDC